MRALPEPYALWLGSSDARPLIRLLDRTRPDGLAALVACPETSIVPEGRVLCGGSAHVARHLREMRVGTLICDLDEPNDSARARLLRLVEACTNRRVHVANTGWQRLVVQQSLRHQAALLHDLGYDWPDVPVRAPHVTFGRPTEPASGIRVVVAGPGSLVTAATLVQACHDVRLDAHLLTTSPAGRLVNTGETWITAATLPLGVLPTALHAQFEHAPPDRIFVIEGGFSDLILRALWNTAPQFLVLGATVKTGVPNSVLIAHELIRQSASACGQYAQLAGYSLDDDLTSTNAQAWLEHVRTYRPERPVMASTDVLAAREIVNVIAQNRALGRVLTHSTPTMGCG